MSGDPRVAALLEFGTKIKPQELFPVLQEGASSVIEDNPFAFALAAVLDRGTKSEIIWTIPYYLQKKVGKVVPQFFVEKSIEEDKELLAAGFEYVTEREGLKIYRKPK